VDNLRQTLGAYPRRALYVRPVKDSSFFQRGDGIAIKFCPSKIRQQQHRFFWLLGNEGRDQLRHLLHFSRSAARNINQEDGLAFMADEADTIFGHVTLPSGQTRASISQAKRTVPILTLLHSPADLQPQLPSPSQFHRPLPTSSVS